MRFLKGEENDTKDLSIINYTPIEEKLKWEMYSFNELKPAKKIL